MRLFSALPLRIILLTIVLAAAAPACGQGIFPPVTESQLRAAKLIHYYTEQDKMVQPPDFTWQFEKDHLKIAAGSGPIPRDLTDQLAPGANQPTTIEARWKIAWPLLLIELTRIDGKPVTGHAQLPMMCTAASLVRIGKRQYCFVWPYDLPR